MPKQLSYIVTLRSDPRIEFVAKAENCRLFHITAFAELLYIYLKQGGIPSGLMNRGKTSKELFSQKRFYTINGSFSRWCENQLFSRKMLLKSPRFLDEDSILQLKLLHGKFSALVGSGKRAAVYRKLGCHVLTYLQFAIEVGNQNVISLGLEEINICQTVLLEGSATRTLKKSLEELHHIHIPFTEGTRMVLRGRR